MTEETKGRKITFHCSEELAERLDRMAEMGDIPRSKLVAIMVEVWIDYLELTKKVGILQLSLLIRDAGDTLKDVAKKWREKKSFKDLTV